MTFDPKNLKQLYIPKQNASKGENGKLLIVGGSHLFHAASLWSLTVASRIVDMVFYASVKENNEIVNSLKKEFRNGIVIRRNDLDHYAKEADCILIGPGLMRINNSELTIQNSELNLENINTLKDEGEQTLYLTKYLLSNYPSKRFVIDAGALQMLYPDFLLNLSKMPILTPHKGEFERLLGKTPDVNNIQEFSKKYNCVVLLKGEKDLIVSPTEQLEITGGNPGMAKGGTGDVLAGLVAGLYTQNENSFLVACASSFINKKAGDQLFKTMGFYFNASDLANEIPKVMKKYLLD